jgi:hypothetical protein
MKTSLFLPFFLFCETNKLNAQINYVRPSDSTNGLTEFILISIKTRLISPWVVDKTGFQNSLVNYASAIMPMVEGTNSKIACYQTSTFPNYTIFSFNKYSL